MTKKPKEVKPTDEDAADDKTVGGGILEWHNLRS